LTVETVGWLKIVGKIKSMGKNDWLHSFFMVVISSSATVGHVKKDCSLTAIDLFVWLLLREFNNALNNVSNCKERLPSMSSTQ